MTSPVPLHDKQPGHLHLEQPAFQVPLENLQDTFENFHIKNYGSRTKTDHEASLSCLVIAIYFNIQKKWDTQKKISWKWLWIDNFLDFIVFTAFSVMCEGQNKIRNLGEKKRIINNDRDGLVGFRTSVFYRYFFELDYPA